MIAKRKKTQDALRLFFISFLLLFFEILFIRWLAAYVPFVTFFTNFVLIASFVGMSLGCLAAERPSVWLGRSPWFLFIIIALAGAVQTMVRRGMFRVRVDNPNSPEQIFFGTTWQVQDFSGLAIPIDVILAVFYVTLVLFFAGLGQLLGRYMNRFENRIAAYSINIAGSLFGIAGFGILSFFSLSPTWWFLIGLAGLAFFLFRGDLGHVKDIPDETKECESRSNTQHAAPTTRRVEYKRRLFVLLAAILFSVFLMSFRPPSGSRHILWSPYYKIDYDHQAGSVDVNGIGHQYMNKREKSTAYSIPYLLMRDSGLALVRRALIIGAGTGNDVAHALWNGVESVDAAEIDPRIAQIGRRDHPDRPYDDTRVRLRIGDGRFILENADKKYDMIIYALVDSLTLHSSYSSVRLESFLFTTEAFEAAKRHLSDEGVFVAYNWYREGWLVVRIYEMLRRVFGNEPLVFSLPAREEISDTEPEGRKLTILMAGNIEKIREHFAEYGKYVLKKPAAAPTERENGFLEAAESVSEGGHVLFPSRVSKSREVTAARDDWPFVYLREKRIPWQNIRVLVLVAVLSALFLFYFRGRDAFRLNGHFLFLGTGFMLIETLSIVRLSILFGSTWVVNSVVFSSILFVSLLSSLYAAVFHPVRFVPYYAGLFVSILATGFLDMNMFLPMSAVMKTFWSGLCLFTPVFFAGIIFASSFRESKNPDLDFGSNIAGVVLGAMLESISLVVGYKAMTLLILLCYILSCVGKTSRQMAVSK